MRFLQTEPFKVFCILAAITFALGFILFGCAHRPTAMDYAKAVQVEMDGQ